MNQLKSFLKHLKANPIYAGDFIDRANVFSQFQKDEDPKIVILYANYDNEDYEGSATVFYYRKDTRKYYEAYGSHCSCYGLEDQWGEEKEELVPKELERRLSEGRLCDGEVFKVAYQRFLAS